jgi:hypothetical protein
VTWTQSARCSTSAQVPNVVDRDEGANLGLLQTAAKAGRLEMVPVLFEGLKVGSPGEGHRVPHLASGHLDPVPWRSRDGVLSDLLLE